jgi:hypothetical protein
MTIEMNLKGQVEVPQLWQEWEGHCRGRKQKARGPSLSNWVWKQDVWKELCWKPLNHCLVKKRKIPFSHVWFTKVLPKPMFMLRKWAVEVDNYRLASFSSWKGLDVRDQRKTKVIVIAYQVIIAHSAKLQIVNYLWKCLKKSNLFLSSFFSLLFLFIYLFCGSRAWTQGLELARESLYHLNHSTS